MDRGGEIEPGLWVLSGSHVTILGGAIGDKVHTDIGSQLTIGGNEFRLNGVPIEGLANVGDSLQLDAPHDGLLAGILADGTPIAFSRQSTVQSDSIEGTLILESTLFPAIGSPLIIASKDTVPFGIRDGQTLVVDHGGVVGHDLNAGMGSFVHV